MINSETFKKVCMFSAKGIGWLLYAAFLEYCVHSITMYFLREPRDESEVDTVFFTERDYNCWSHITMRKPCGQKCSYSRLRKILGVMDKAKHSLDICIYSVTSYDFALCIVDIHKQGVKVRLITDGYRIKGTGSQIMYLASGGIPIRIIQSGREMHHKFFMVDRETLVNCSFNWTMQAITGNSEDAVITSDKVIVEKFVGHFDALWNTAIPFEKPEKELTDKEIDQSTDAAQSSILQPS
ncbi:Uncharacterized protein GBIM_14613 [Gryllus bimaculatus]|nr:Uncharacterized protein GBIM_14613 [Gryllus bimaculatus]